MGSRTVLIAAACLAAVAGTARADVHIAVQGPSDCPAPADVRAALPVDLVGVDVAEAGAWRAEITRTGRTTRVVLHGPDGARSFTRSLRSRDCSALAAAVAEVLRAHFVELRLLPPAPPATPEPPEPAPVEPVAVPAPPPPEQVAAPVTVPAPPAPPPPSPPSPPPPSSAPERPTRRAALVVALDAGAGIASDGPVRPAVRARASVRVVGPIFAAACVGLVAPEERASGIDRVRSVPAHVLAGAAVRAPIGPVQLELGASGGVEIVVVTALDLDGAPSTLRAIPVVAADAAVSLPIVGPLAVRLAAGALLAPRQDRYVIAPEGVVTSAPRARVFATAGLELGL